MQYSPSILGYIHFFCEVFEFYMTVFKIIVMYEQLVLKYHRITLYIALIHVLFIIYMYIRVY